MCAVSVTGINTVQRGSWRSGYGNRWERVSKWVSEWVRETKKKRNFLCLANTLIHCLPHQITAAYPSLLCGLDAFCLSKSPPFLWMLDTEVYASLSSTCQVLFVYSKLDHRVHAVAYNESLFSFQTQMSMSTLSVEPDSLTPWSISFPMTWLSLEPTWLTW